MPKIDLIHNLLKSKNLNLSLIEKYLLEAKLLTIIYQELLNYFFGPYKNYLFLSKMRLTMEEKMIDQNFIQEILKDILLSEEYSLEGIVNYTQIPEDVLLDIIEGKNKNPTFEVSRKLFDLHILIRPQIYNGILKKVILQYQTKIIDKE